MKSLSAADIRRQFIDFFVQRGHHEVTSSSLIPANDPTLLFTNAGMVQFKERFQDPASSPYKRAVSVQRCLRVGGKHNDLENVGYTARHHTFFEMLGNFSFGDYFKEEAIAFAWKFLVDVLKLPKDKLFITVFEDDDEAEQIWLKKIGLDKKNVSRKGAKDNFWSMGDTGPCGPCSEIHFDLGPSIKDEDERYLEIWNLVFMQFNQDSSGKRTKLPKPCVDTGMGLERIVAVVQAVKSNYDTDAFQTLIQATQQELKLKKKIENTKRAAFNVVADHSRAAAFMISDGIIPANDGRGYVLRRLLRRAMRYGRKLGADQPFLFEIASVVIDEMSAAYPHLVQKSDEIKNYIKDEEEQFLRTLENGLKHFEDSLQQLKLKKNTPFPGDVAFHLYETFGFPVDLTEDMLKEKQMTLDRKAFDQAFELHRQKAKGTWKKDIAFDHNADKFIDGIAKDGVKPTAFVGYEYLEQKANVVAITNDKWQALNQTMDGDNLIVVDTTPFYAESGGQIGDSGWIRTDSAQAEIVSTRKHRGYFFHTLNSLTGHLSVGDTVTLKVNRDERCRTANNHSVTHLLHAALRHILGDHVRQAGSYLDGERLTFDFVHAKAVTAEQLQAIESLVNQRIWENHVVTTETMAYDQAIEKGATAFFEEKYGDKVRVVSIGDFSMELCGGTHVGERRTGAIGLFHIVGEKSVAAKTRRIEAVTGAFALAAMHAKQKTLTTIGSELKSSGGDLTAKVKGLVDENKSLRKKLENAEQQQLSGDVSGLVEKAKDCNGIKVVTQVVDNAAAGTLRNFSDQILDKMQSGIVVLGSKNDGRALLLVKVSKDLTKKYSASDIIKKISPSIGGMGGGRADMAQAGGNQPENLKNALSQVADCL